MIDRFTAISAITVVSSLPRGSALAADMAVKAPRPAPAPV
jgi:hypothetical protein